MSDIGIIAVVSASGNSGQIEFRTTMLDTVCPFNTTVRFGILSNKKGITYSIIQDTGGTIQNVPAISFDDFGTTESGETLTVITIEADTDYITTFYKIRASLNQTVYAFSNRFRILPELDFGVSYSKTISIDDSSATNVVFDNASQSFSIPIIKTFDVTGLAPQGQIAYTSPGTYNWQVPAGVCCVSMVGIGGGGAGGGAYGTQLDSFWGKGGGGAALAWGNATVTPGDTIKVEVGAGGIGQIGASGNPGNPTRICHVGNNCAFLSAGGGAGGGTAGLNNYDNLAPGGTYTADTNGLSPRGGGDGGSGGGTERVTLPDGSIQYGYPGGGGGAGGYFGAGGNAGPRSLSPSDSYGTNGTAGGGGGGYRASGGGVGLWQIGQDGVGGTDSNGFKGTNGSSGAAAYYSVGEFATDTSGWFGQGAAGKSWPGEIDQCYPGFSGGNGAARIVWGGSRTYSDDQISTPNNDDVIEVVDGEVTSITSDSPIINYTLSGTIPSTVQSAAKGIQRNTQFDTTTDQIIISIPVADDALDDEVNSNTGSFTFNLVSSTDDYTIENSSINLSILQNPNPPLREVGFSDTEYSVDEGTSLNVTIRRTQTRNGQPDLGESLDVSWEIDGIDGSFPDNRWSATSGTVTIPSNRDSVTFSIPLGYSNIDLASFNNEISITNVSDPRFSIVNSSTITINNIYRTVAIVESAEVDEGTTAELLVTRLYKYNGVEQTPNEPLLIPWSFTTNLNDDRISQSSGTVSFVNDSNTANIEIIINEEEDLQQVTFNTVRLLDAGNYEITNENCQLRINDSITEIKNIEIVSDPLTVAEGTNFTVLLNRVHTVDGVEVLSDTPSVAWVLSNTDSRFAASSGVSRWTAGEEQLSIVIPTTSIDTYIGDIVATITFYNPSNLYEIIGNDSITLTLNEDNEQPDYEIISDDIIRAGQPLAVTFNTTNVTDGAIYKWKINHQSTNNFDFTSIIATQDFSVTNNSNSAYTFTGNGLTGFDNPDLVLTRGRIYSFDVDANNHPFYIKTVRVTGSSGQMSGVTNNGAQSGTVQFTPDANTPDTLYYVCGLHLVMSGTIRVVDSADGLEDYFYIQNNTGSFTLQTVADTETVDEAFQIEFYDSNNVLITTSTNITVKPSMQFGVSAVAVDEGSSVAFTIYTVAAEEHTYAISGTNINANDFDEDLTGTFTPTADLANYGYSETLTFNLTEDITSEGEETFNLTITDPLEFTSPTITINDTSETPATGSQTFTTTQSWIVPSGVTSVSAVVIGGGGGGAGHLLAGSNNITNTGSGGGGGGGGLAWAESIPVTPGEELTVSVGVAGAAGTANGSSGGSGGDSLIRRGNTVLISAQGGSGGQQTWATFQDPTQSTGGATNNGGTGGSITLFDSSVTAAGQTQGNTGGTGGNTDGQRGGGGGGTAGYTGAGGNGAGRTTQEPGSGSGGGGGGAHESANFYYTVSGTGIYDPTTGGGGGGTGILGAGSSGSAGTQGSAAAYTSDKNGQGGSGGADGTGTGGQYGAGGGGSSGGNNTAIPSDIGAAGNRGVVRLVWGSGYSYPNNAV